MRVAILESIIMPAGHEVEFDRILVEELKNKVMNRFSLCRNDFPLSWIIIAMSIILKGERLFLMPVSVV